MIKLYKARSLLYRRQILQENIRWKALDEIYKIYMLLHRSDLNISENFRQTFSHFSAKFYKIRDCLILFGDFCSDFDDFFVLKSRSAENEYENGNSEKENGYDTKRNILRKIILRSRK